MNPLTGLREALSWLRCDIQELLAPLAIGEPIERRQEFLDGPEGRYQLLGERWKDAPETVSIHYCRAQSRKYDVGMLMIYPTASPERLPVLGAEWVVVGNRCQMIGIDIHPAGGQPQLDEELTLLFSGVAASDRALLPQNNPLPDWAARLSRPWGVFVSGPESLLPPTRRVFQQYLSVGVERFYRPRQSSARGGPDAPAVRDYRNHHARHSPGRALLARAFGPDLANDFVNWHFGTTTNTPGQRESSQTRS